MARKDGRPRSLPQPQLKPLGTCMWFAMCDRPAAGLVAHPVLTDIPTCKECADALGLTFKEI